MKVWITKYALTKGIREADASVVEEHPNMIEIKRGSSPGYLGEYFHKGEWYDTREAAVKQAENMRKSKVISIEKQLARIKALTFE